MLVGDPDGRVRYLNAAARAVLAYPDGDDLIGRPVEELLARAPRGVPPRRPLPEGGSVWYLGFGAVPARDDARFAAEVSDALAGTLDPRRTLGCIVDLAVPALGEWAGVTLWETDRLRQVARAAGAVHDRVVALARLPDDDRKWLRALMDSTPDAFVARAATELTVLGCSDQVAAALSQSGPVSVATAPLRAHGAAVGLLSVAAGKGRPIDRAGLEALARRGAVAVSAARVFEERSRLAETLRSALRPRPLPTVEGVLLGAAYRPAQETTEIGGDFYEMYRDGRGWTFSLGDVCGKGVEAAVLTGQVRQSLRAVSLVDPDPAARLELLNSALLDSDGTSFVTVVHGVIRPGDGGVAVRLASGGHPPPLLCRADGTVEEVPAEGPLVGMLSPVRFESVDVRLVPGDTLVCYTDGIPDARGPGGFLGPERLARLLAASAGLSAQAIADGFVETALHHLDGRPHDDMAVLAVQVDHR